MDPPSPSPCRRRGHPLTRMVSRKSFRRMKLAVPSLAGRRTPVADPESHRSIPPARWPQPRRPLRCSAGLPRPTTRVIHPWHTGINRAGRLEALHEIAPTCLRKQWRRSRRRDAGGGTRRDLETSAQRRTAPRTTSSCATSERSSVASFIAPAIVRDHHLTTSAITQTPTHLHRRGPCMFKASTARDNHECPRYRTTEMNPGETARETNHDTRFRVSRHPVLQYREVRGGPPSTSGPPHIRSQLIPLRCGRRSHRSPLPRAVGPHPHFRHARDILDSAGLFGRWGIEQTGPMHPRKSPPHDRT